MNKQNLIKILILFLLITGSTSSSVAQTCPKAIDDSATTSIGISVTIDILANDINMADAKICEIQSPHHGTAVQNGNIVTYTPASGFCGKDSFSYSLCKSNCDNSTATVYLDVPYPDCGCTDKLPRAPDIEVKRGTKLNNAFFISKGVGCSGCNGTPLIDYDETHKPGRYTYTVTCKVGECDAVSAQGRLRIR
jgi:hypothetical protein